MRRGIVAVIIATLAALLLYNNYRLMPPGWHSDFSLSWFGARSMLYGINPYPLVGPGLSHNFDFPLLYPATAFVVAIPFASLPEYLASAVFVWISTALLVYGITAKSWHLLPIIPSVAFVMNARIAQWTILTTAILFLPMLAFLSASKPQAAFPAVVTSRRTWVSAITGGVILLAASLIFLPHWPREWLELARNNSAHLRPPILSPLGFLVAFVLLKWRRREAQFVFLLACMPQTWDYYNTLPLLAFAATYREACILSLVASLGGFVWIVIGRSVATDGGALLLYGQTAIVLFAYLPIVYAILRRPNEGESPVWLRVPRFGLRHPAVTTEHP